MMELSQNILCLIPARGGSKRIPQKNTLPLAGIPLVVHSIRHATQSTRISAVAVTSEDPTILALAQVHGAHPIKRPDSLAADESTSESALLHALEEWQRQGHTEPDLLVFLQPTSPIRRSDDIDRAIAQLEKEQADSLFSACINKTLLWTTSSSQLRPLNYDYTHRKREQDMPVQYNENGSIYVLKPSVLRTHNNRLGGKITTYEMETATSFQIDEPIDLTICENLLRRPEFSPPPPWPSKIELVVFDFDGVLTDNAVYVNQEGQEMVRCSRGDGLGLEQLRQQGVPLLVLSKEKNPVVAARCQKLGLPCHQGIDTKAHYLTTYCKKNHIDLAHVIYLGNDTNDLEVMSKVGLPVAVADSHPQVLQAASLVLKNKGGHGAARELCELVQAKIAE